MEKLIFISVMYGVDKVPDKWFDKVPGGYFKEKEKEGEEKEKTKRRKEKESKSGSRRSRRNSDGHSDRRTRSKTRSKTYDRRSKTAYDMDGANDESGDERHRRRRSAGHRRRRRSVDDDRYGYDDGYGRPPSGRREGHDGRRRSQQGAPPGYAPPAVGARTAQYTPPINPPAPGSVPPGGFTASPANGYTPYSHIYGQSPQPPAGSGVPPPPPQNHMNGSARAPNGINTAVPPPPSAAPMMQSPYAQSPTYPPGAPPIQPPPMAQSAEPRVDPRYNRRTPPSHSPSPPRRHRSRRSHPSDGYSDYESEFSDDDRYARRKQEARSKSLDTALTTAPPNTPAMGATTHPAVASVAAAVAPAMTATTPTRNPQTSRAPQLQQQQAAQSPSASSNNRLCARRNRNPRLLPITYEVGGGD
ncbi:hypothetical protein MBLNU230_g7494t1 [Neophaeotheca triangularis]